MSLKDFEKKIRAILSNWTLSLSNHNSHYDVSGLDQNPKFKYSQFVLIEVLFQNGHGTIL